MRFISIDVETDGPAPGKCSMLSLGAVAYDPLMDKVGEFYLNIIPLPEATPDPSTTAWWDGQPEAKLALTDPPPMAAKDAMRAFHAWLKPGDVAVCFPAGFDFTFVYWYLHTFVGESRLGFAALDIKSYIHGKFGLPYKKCTKKNLPAHLRPQGKHTHNALDDAREQGDWFKELRLANGL